MRKFESKLQNMDQSNPDYKALAHMYYDLVTDLLHSKELRDIHSNFQTPESVRRARKYTQKYQQLL